MTDDELRKLVRSAVARHLGGPPEPADAAPRPLRGASPVSPRPALAHPSHHVYLTVVNTGEACVIEPTVLCDHCGYCRSHGH
jgi:hypothetical protein